MEYSNRTKLLGLSAEEIITEKQIALLLNVQENSCRESLSNYRKRKEAIKRGDKKNIAEEEKEEEKTYVQKNLNPTSQRVAVSNVFMNMNHDDAEYYFKNCMEELHEDIEKSRTKMRNDLKKFIELKPNVSEMDEKELRFILDFYEKEKEKKNEEKEEEKNNKKGDKRARCNEDEVISNGEEKQSKEKEHEPESDDASIDFAALD